MATAEMSYTASVSQTVTNLASLTNGSWWQSAVIDNSSFKYIDAYLGGGITVNNASAPTDGSTIDIYVYGENFDGSYTGGASGSEGTYTADGEEDEFMFLTSITVDTTTGQEYEFGPVSVAAAFGGILPRKWGVIIENNTGQTLHSTGQTIYYTGIKYVSA